MIKKKRLPVGNTIFAEMRTEGYYYVDKTPLIVDLLQNSKFVFLSRPRRFGKSLTLDTIAQLFAGRKELFTGLYAEEHWDWSEKYPVIRLSFVGQPEKANVQQLRERIGKMLRQNADNLGIELADNVAFDVGSTLEDLIRCTAEKYQKKVVILIDEYDKPIIDNLSDKAVADEVRSLLASLYSNFKACEEYIRFGMLTGVSKFGQMSLFSGLNNLKDISLRPEFSALCGYTQTELEEVFSPELQGVDMEAVKLWYNGYNWGGESVYNPFDVLLFLDEGKRFQNYWINTGNTTLLEYFFKKHEFELSEITKSIDLRNLISPADTGRMEALPVLFQTGYLTIDKVIDEPGQALTYSLKFPNLEVRQSLSQLWITSVMQVNGLEEVNNVRRCLRSGNVEKVQQMIKSAIAKIPSDVYRRNEIAKYEGHWQSMMGMYFAGACTDFILEDASHLGKADMTIKEGGYVYIFEFKVKTVMSAQQALAQIHEKKYAEQYRAEAKQIFEIGVSFDPETREVEFAV